MKSIVVSAAAALAIAPSAALAAPLELHLDVTPSAAPQEVQMVERDVAPGERAGAHIHHGVEMAYVVKGDLEFEMAGQAPRIVHAGDSVVIPRDTPHAAKNIGTTEAVIIATYLIDKGAPWRIPVPESALARPK
jgi:quercetin dioxygenase-like cupin family protein